MNQIIVVKQVNKLHKNFFKIQFVISILLIIIVSFFMLKKWNENREMEQVSEIVNKAFDLENVYIKRQNVKEHKNKYFGKIIIPKIKLEYSVFDECSEELLKVLPCKFYGGNIREKGNICIAGHNYNDTRFFSRLNEMQIGEKIYLSDLGGKNYQYIIYDKYKVKSDDFESLKSQRTYDLTLITCDNSNGKRLIIRASRI